MVNIICSVINWNYKWDKIIKDLGFRIAYGEKSLKPTLSYNTIHRQVISIPVGLPGRKCLTAIIAY